MQSRSRYQFAIMWLLLGSIAAAMASLCWPAAHFGDELLPVGIDSFYHARRILDTAAEPGSFYEFDPKIHAPEGSLLTWPWAYDYSLGLLLHLAMKLGIVADPIALLIWIPVACAFVSIGLVLLISRRLSLSTPSMIFAGLCVALSPLTQFLHGVGQIDHHYAEYIFVLLTLVAGLGWFRDLGAVRKAIAMGVVLGIAPSIHNGLFILQVPVLMGLLALWLQSVEIPRRATLSFALALLIATLVVLLPSLSFRTGLFEFYLLSWFHLYIAACSAIVAIALSRIVRSARGILTLATLSVLLLVPIVHQALIARSFLGGTSIRLDAIREMQPLWQQISTSQGARDMWNFYSLFVFASPATFVYCLYMGWKERHSGRVFFWITAVSGLLLLTLQFRLHYFGSFALYLPWLIFVDTLTVQRPADRKQVLLITALVLVLMYYRPLRYQLAAPWSPANDPTFSTIRPMLTTLRKACAADPAIVLADNDAGHYIRYYTDCAVIANNFLLTPQHAEKIRETDHLLSLAASQLPDAAPLVRYVFIRPLNVIREKNAIRYVPYSPNGDRLIADLLRKPRDTQPAAYVLLDEVLLRGVDGIPYARLYRIDRRATR